MQYDVLVENFDIEQVRKSLAEGYIVKLAVKKETKVLESLKQGKMVFLMQKF